MVNDTPMYSISYHKPQRLVRLTWLPGTADMNDQDFKRTLEAFGQAILQHSAQNLIIDMREFRHKPSADVLAWRDDVIVSRRRMM